MANTAFDDFINRQAAGPDDPAVDWDERRQEWLRYLAEFYDTVQGYLDKYVRGGQVRLRHDVKRLNEEYVGSYEAPTLEVEIGANTIRFDPVGTNLIGARGRVDMRGAGGVVKFVLAPDEASGPGVDVRVAETGEALPPEAKNPVERWTWKIATPPPGVRYVELREESFQDAVMEVVNG